MKKNEFYDRELSWLSFNYRVLQEAKDKSVPLFERIKFLAIYSSNLDEFFRVRVASLRSLLSLKTKTQKKLKFDPQKLLNSIKQTVSKQQEEFGKIYREEIIPELNNENIFIVDEKNITDNQLELIKTYFNDQIIPFAQPNLLDKNKISTFLHNRAIYVAVRLKNKSRKSKNNKSNFIRFKYAIVEIASDRLGRFVTLPSSNGKNYLVFLDDAIRLNLPDLLPGYSIESCYSIKLTRDAELYIDDEFSGDLLSKIKKGLLKRKTGVPCRFLYDKGMPDDFLKFLRTSLKLNKNDLIPGGKYHNFHDFFNFPKFNKRHLEYEAMPPFSCKEFDGANSILELLSKKDILLNFPYQSYGYIINLLEEAANDVKVKSIKITLYRVANESLIIRSLCKAVENGKKVTAFVEYKARFDEEANFVCAEILHKAGVKVYSSFPGLKVHCKLCLIERTENKKSKYYIYLATGNFNEKTARIYCDCALLTTNTDFSKDAQNLFNILQRKSKKESFNHLIVAPFNLRKEFTRLIKQEINNANEGKQAEIILKLNSLEDRKMIKKLYEASNAGVKVKIIVRGICCLVPGIKDQSENIDVISIVDRFLEHTRIYIFHNNGDKKYFLASADWMRRNLNRRIEIGFPIYDKQIQSTLQKMIDIQWNDNVKARIIDSKQSNNFKKVEKGEKIRSQYEFYKWLSNS